METQTSFSSFKSFRHSVVLSIFLSFFWTVALAEPKHIQFPVTAFSIDGTLPIASSLADESLIPFTNKDHSLDSLRDAAKALESVIRSEGFSFYRVVVPPQTLDQGIVKLKVVEFVLGDVTLKGNSFFDTPNVRHSLPDLIQGQSPNTEEIAQQLKVANRHPSKDLKLTFKQSKTSGFVDAVLNVEEQKPEQFSLIMTNTGNDATGDFRVTAAYQHSNLWNKDHLFNASYTTSPDHLDDVKQYGLSYSLPLYNHKAWLSSYYVHSSVDTGTVASVFDVSGAGDMMGVHWLQYLPRENQYEHWLDIGFDSRYFENDIDFLGTPIGVDVRSFPVSFLYKGEFSWPSTKVDFNIQYLRNTGLGSENDGVDYAASRLGASDSWDAFRYGVTVERNIDKFVFRATLDGQFSDEALISGEQFGIGGSSSVRGYEERETAADSGSTIKLELHSPRFNGISLVGFYDHGFGSIESPLADDDKSWSLSSLGIGARGQFGEHILASIDLAHTLKDSISTSSGDDFLHATIVLQY